MAIPSVPTFEQLSHIFLDEKNGLTFWLHNKYWSCKKNVCVEQIFEGFA
jgi:hypothetical protein